MKTILATLFSLVSFFAFSQSNDQFRLVGSGTWSTVNDSTYQSTVSFMSDLTGGGFLATQIADTFRLFTGAEKIYRVDTVWSKTFSSATMRVVEYNGTNGAPSGQVMVYDPDGRSTIPQVPFGSTGATAQLQAAVVTYNAKQDLIVADDDYGDISVLTSVWNIDANTVGNNEMANDAIGSAEVINRSIALVDLANDATISGNANTASDTLTNAFQKIIVDLNDGSIATRNNATTTQRTLANGFNVMLANATASTGGTFTPDLSAGAIFKHTVSSGSTLTVANATNNASGRFGNIYRTILKNSSGGSLTISFGTAYLEQDWTQASNLTLANTDSIIIDWKSEFKGGAYVLTAMSDLGGGGSGISDGDKGDIDVVSSTDWRVDTAAITLVKMASNSVDSSKIVAGGVGVTDASAALITHIRQPVVDSTTAHRTDINNLQALTGRGDGSTNLGTMSQGTQYPDNLSIKTFADSTDAKIGRARNGIGLDASQYKVLGGTYFLNHPSKFSAGRKLNWGNYKTYIGTDDADSLQYVVFDIPNKRLGIGTGSPLAEIHVGNQALNNSADAAVIISRTGLPAGIASHAFSVSDQVDNSMSYNAFDARFTVTATPGGADPHIANYQIGSIYNADIPTHYGMVDIVSGTGTVDNFYGFYSRPICPINNFVGFSTPSVPTVNTSFIGAQFSSITAPTARGVVISGLTGSTTAHGISISSIASSGGRPRAIYTSNTPSEYNYSTTGDVDMTIYSKLSVNAGDGIGTLYEGGGGATKYYAARVEGDWDGSLRGGYNVYINKTGGSGLGNLTAVARFSRYGLKLGDMTDATAWMHLAAGATAANSAPLKFTSGTLLTTAEAGAVEFLTDKFYGTITTGAARKEITLNDAALTSGAIPTATTNGRLTDSGLLTNVTSAALSVPSTTKGFLPPRMTTTQRNAISSPATGLQVYNTSLNKMNFYNGSAWVALVDSVTALGWNHSATQDIDMNSFDLTEVDSLTSAGTVTINSTASQIPLNVIGSFHSLSEFRSPNASGNAGIYLGNSADDNNTYGFYRIGNGNLILSMSNDYPFASEDDSIFHYNASTRVIDFRTSAIHLNGSPLAGTVGGAGQTNKLPVWTSSGNIGFESSMHVDTTNNRLGLGTATPDKTLGLGDGTDEFSISTASDKLTVWNDVSTPVAVVTIDSAGTLDAKGLKINGASILDGTWTPTLTNTLNVSASTAYACNYVRVGNTVTVSGRVDVDATATGSVLLEMSLPIASDFAAFENAGGTAAGTTGTVSAIYASHTNDRLVFAYTAAVTTNEPLHFSATYRIL